MKPILVLQHVAHESLAAVEDYFRRAGLEWRYVTLFERPEAPPPRLPLDDAAGLVVLGGPMNVDQTEQFPYLAPEVDWIREALERELPLMGVCLGSQLLAKALGARVYPNGRKEIGWYPLQLTPAAGDDPLFAGSTAEQMVFQWHGDTFDLPEGAVHLASSAVCRNQAFRHGPAAWGLQFHIEMTSEAIESWLNHPGNQEELAALPEIDPVAIRAATPENLPRMRALGDVVLTRFAAMCRERAG